MERRDPYSITPRSSRRALSSVERASFLRAAEAVNDPIAVLATAQKGLLSRDHVEAVRAVYPGIYQEIRRTVLESAMNRPTPLPYQVRVQVALLLDGATDRTMAPGFLRNVAATYEQQPPPEANGQQKVLNKPLKLADATATMFSVKTKK